MKYTLLAAGNHQSRFPEFVHPPPPTIQLKLSITAQDSSASVLTPLDPGFPDNLAASQLEYKQ